MLDEEGCFHRTSEDAQKHGDPAAMERELREQVSRALKQGIGVTHVDTHMGTVAHPALMERYAAIARDNRLPAMIFRMDEAGWRAQGLDAGFARVAAGFVRQLEAAGMPLLDSMAGMPLDSKEDRLDIARAKLSGLPTGVTHFILHPSKDTPELRAVSPRDWQCRAADYRTFMDDAVRRHLRDIGVHTIGYKALKDLMPRA
jgi:chitin disaccharide deacetylase